ncbi:hypothetical protein [Telmatospirillum siberiense]|uniref:Uncharacterized protein n=1 Tax=Telmatospirillum siberiense TaxID=382514 RepID=A0A2N3PVA7_9PROT|nr:hypothetical protein [Telmatospirillum siberiense]PKU24320.1 hypothetical protein CWS72_12050 [Telmatospirillum siberiense]
MNRRKSRRGAEQRRRFFLIFGKLLVAAGVVGVMTYYAYEVGFRVASGETAALTEGLRNAEEQLKTQQIGADADRAALGEANKRVAELKAAYDQIRPSDDMRDLTALLRDKMATGVTARRLALVIKSAEMPRSCQALPNRRLQVRALHAKSSPGVTQLRFDEKVTLSAEETDARDPRQPAGGSVPSLKLHVSAEGGRETDVTGIPPIDYAIAVQGAEYHFIVAPASAKGWLDVATEKCSFR